MGFEAIILLLGLVNLILGIINFKKYTTFTEDLAKIEVWKEEFFPYVDDLKNRDEYWAAHVIDMKNILMDMKEIIVEMNGTKKVIAKPQPAVKKKK